MYRHMNWRGFVVILAVILIVFLPLHLTMKAKRAEQDERKTAENAKLIQQEELNQKLKRKLENTETGDYIAQVAIQKYDFVNKNDIRFEIVNPDALNLYTDEEIQILIQEMAE